MSESSRGQHRGSARRYAGQSGPLMHQGLYSVAAMAGQQAVLSTRLERRTAERPGVSWWFRLKYGIVRAFLWGWARCFSLTGLYKFGQFFGFCEYLVNYKRRARFGRKLGEIYGDDITSAEARRRTIRFVIYHPYQYNPEIITKIRFINTIHVFFFADCGMVRGSRHGTRNARLKTENATKTQD